jgi:perosamine synthetase
MTQTTKYNIAFGRPWITQEERDSVLKVLDNDILTHGPENAAFQDEFSAMIGGTNYCIAMSSCMAALHLSLWALGIKKGDDVLVPAQTHTATVHAVEVVGAKPIFVDCELQTGNVTIENLMAAKTPATKAIVLVHFLGIPCDMPAIMKWANENNLKVVEDAALAVGSRINGQHVGTFGDAGCFSFYPAKHITTGEGGMFVTKDKKLAEQVLRLRGFGVDRTINERKIPGLYDVTELGVNYRMSEFNATIGRCQIKKLPEILKIREANFTLLKKLLSKASSSSIIDSNSRNFTNSHYCLTWILPAELREKRNDIALKLKDLGIGTSIYYPQPVPRMTYYKEKYGYKKGAYKNAECISDGSLALPVGPHLSSEDINIIATECLKTIERV